MLWLRSPYISTPALALTTDRQTGFHSQTSDYTEPLALPSPRGQAAATKAPEIPPRYRKGSPQCILKDTDCLQGEVNLFPVALRR